MLADVDYHLANLLWPDRANEARGWLPGLALTANGRIGGAMELLPASDLINTGIADLRNRRETIAALLVAIGAPKLQRLGLKLPSDLPSNPEHRLYDLLSSSESDSAHSRYNALIRKLVSFQRALECVKK